MFYIHSFQVICIIAVLFTAIGFAVGSILWRDYKTQASATEQQNAELQEELSCLQDNLVEMREDLDQLKAPTSKESKL